MAVPTKAEQAAEGTARELAAQKLGVQPGEGDGALDVIDDTAGDAPQPQSAAPQAPAADAEPQLPTPRPDNKRADIISRFRADRAERDKEERAEIDDFARSHGMPPEFQAQPEPASPEAAEAGEGAAAAEPEPPAPAPKIKLKVRGQDLELSLDEVVAHAQTAMAAENYLDEAKGKLGEVDALLQRTKAQAPRAGTDGIHPAEPKSAQTPATGADPAASATADPQHPEDDELGKLIETIQFGDPAEAKTLLAQTIGREVAKAVPKVVTTALQSDRLKDEAARSQKVLDDFKTAHADLANDPLASAAMERLVYGLQVEDIRALGVDPATLGNGAPAVIAEAHKYYRANGFKVRTPAEMLQTAADKFLEWKGVAKTNEPAPPAQKGAPRIEVDRSARRQAIPQQPSRTAAPRPAAAQPIPAPRDRSQVVQNMMRQRSLPRNRGAA